MIWLMRKVRTVISKRRRDEEPQDDEEGEIERLQGTFGMEKLIRHFVLSS
jgi:hypothetical protein